MYPIHLSIEMRKLDQVFDEDDTIILFMGGDKPAINT